MAEAKRDKNHVPTLLGVSEVDQETPVAIWADPTTHELLVAASVSITPSGTQDVNLIQVGGAAVALGQTTMSASLPVTLASNQSALPVTLTSTTITGTVAVTQSGAWSVTANAGTNLNTSLLALESGGNLAAINAKLVSGTDIGDVTVNNAAGASAVNIQDGGNTITVDGTVAFSNTTIAVTNTGTFATQATLQTQTDTVMIGGVNIKEINAVTPLMGNGASGTGALRVTLASDSTGQVTLAAGTNGIGKLTANSGVNIGDVDIAPKTTGGWSVGNFTSGDTYTALTNTAQVIKGSAGKFGGYYIYNPNTSAAYVIVYNIAAASVTVGTSTPKLVFCIPASGGANIELIAGIPFDTAMSIAATTTGGGNTAPSTALEAMVWYV